MIKPRQPVPTLDVPLVGGGRWVLAEQRPENFTLVVFYRGVHCPLCRAYVTELEALVEELAGIGVSVVAVSCDDEDRAVRAVEEWGIRKLPIGFGHSLESARAWGLFVSKAIREGQPNAFGEPGLFLVRPDGILHTAVYNTMPFLRPHLQDVVETVRWVLANDYPARGEL